MEVSDIKVVGEICEVYGKNDGKDVKYSFSLSSSRVLRFINNYIKKNEEKLNEIKDEIDRDLFPKKLRNAFLCYGISGLLSLFIAGFTFYGNEFLGAIGYFSCFAVFIAGHSINKNIKYEIESDKQQELNEIEEKNEEMQKLKELIKQNITKKEQENELIKKQEEEKKRQEKYIKMQEEEQKIQEERRKESIRSTKLMPHELNILEEITKLAKHLERYQDYSAIQLRKEFASEFLKIKKENPDRRNSDILREILHNLTEEKNKRR